VQMKEHGERRQEASVLGPSQHKGAQRSLNHSIPANLRSFGSQVLVRLTGSNRHSHIFNASYRAAQIHLRSPGSFPHQTPPFPSIPILHHD
jgi:hypothetical protein